MIEAEANLEPNKPAEPTVEYFFIYPAGLMPGFMVSSETIRKAKEAEERFEEKKDKRPPKPPSRPNARIGGIAIENGF